MHISEFNALDHLWDYKSNSLIGIRVMLAAFVLRFVGRFEFYSKEGKSNRLFSVIVTMTSARLKEEMEGVSRKILNLQIFFEPEALRRSALHLRPQSFR